VIHAGGHVLVYALAAAASTLALTATFVVIRSARPRTNGIAFLSGFLLGTTIACGLGLVLGQGAVHRFDSHTTVEGVLTLLLGVVLMLIGLRSLHAAPPPEAETDAGAEGGGTRARAILAGLDNVGPAAAFTMAGLLGFGGPKRLVLTFLAMAAVSGAGVGDIAAGTLITVYIVIASALVSVPVGIVIIAGERAAVILDRGQSWLTAHAAALRLWLSLGIGAALVVDALLRLFV
jgi:Sap, sulfolipid-1-addressing protein